MIWYFDPGKSNFDHYSSKVHGEVKVPPPIQTKSCCNYNNNQRLMSKLPRAIQPDPMNVVSIRKSLPFLINTESSGIKLFFLQATCHVGLI